jgi:hypothetical protein
MMMLLLAGGFALAGCGKGEAPAPAGQSATVDVPKLREAFANASPELQASVAEVATSVRYGQHETTLAALAKLAANPALTEAQKKVVSEVTEQIKQLAAKPAARPAQ